METSSILVIGIYLAFQIKWGMDLGGRDYIKVWLFTDDPDKTLSIVFYIFLIIVLAFLWYIQNNN